MLLPILLKNPLRVVLCVLFFYSQSSLAQAVHKQRKIPSKTNRASVSRSLSLDPCNATYLLHFRSLQDRAETYDVEGTADGGSISVGRLSNGAAFGLKLSGNGSLVWSRTFKIGALDSLTFKRILPTNDGNFLLLGILHFKNNNSVVTQAILVKIDASGDVLWTRKYDFENSDLDFYSVVEASNGDIFVCANSGWGSGEIKSLILRLSETGNIIWKKQVHHQLGSPVYKHLYIDGDGLYLLSDYAQNPVFFRVEKWDAANGQPVWHKRFAVGNSTKVEAGLITKIGDTVYTILSRYYPSADFGGKTVGNALVCKFETGGKFLGDYCVEIPGNSILGYDRALDEHIPWPFLRTSDNNFLIASSCFTGYSTGVAVTKLTPWGKPFWSTTFPYQENYSVYSAKNNSGGYLVTGRLIYSSVDQSQYAGYLMKANGTGEVRPYSNQDPYSVFPCLGAPTLKVVNSFNGVAAATVDIDSVSDISTLSDAPSALISSNLDIDLSPLCSTQSSCTNVSIVGADSICSATMTDTYKVVRNPGCKAPVNLAFDSRFVEITKQEDTTYTLHFKNAGPTTLSVTIENGCSVFTAKKQITVLRHATTLALGADTTLCSDTKIVLNAGAGFESYSWQDGTSDSLMTVNSPGLYYVEVEDHCGNRKRDSIMVKAQQPMVFSIGPDRMRCNTDTVHLQAPAGFLNYAWSPAYNISSTSSASVFVSPAKDTSYFVKGEKTPGCFAYDTVRVRVFSSPAINLGLDQSFCKGDSLLLKAGAGFVSYQWNGVMGQEQKMVYAAGTYSVTATTTDGCQSKDTLQVLQVWPLPLVRLDKTTNLCEGASRQFSAGDFASYLWQDGSTQATFTATVLGRYYVEVKDSHGCAGSDTAEIVRIDPTPRGFLAVDTAVCPGSQLSLSPLKNFTSYLWSDGHSSPSIVVDKPGLYWLEVKDQYSCTGRDSILVRSKQCLTGVYIPTAFTPNGNGRNDVFKAMVYDNLKSFELIVYNRWGTEVFHTTNAGKGWDGRIAGMEQSTGVYVWICHYQSEGGEAKLQKGTVTLLR